MSIVIPGGVLSLLTEVAELALRRLELRDGFRDGGADSSVTDDLPNASPVSGRPGLLSYPILAATEW